MEIYWSVSTSRGIQMFLLYLGGLVLWIVALARIPELVRQRHALGPLEVITLLLVLVTFLLAAATSIQGWAFIQSERSFVVIELAHLKGGTISGSPITVLLNARNS